MRRFAVVAAVAAAAAGAIILGGGGPGVCNVNATTANFATQVAATNPGQTLCLASGDYGTFNGVSKSSPGITIREQDGATATFSTINMKTGAQWFTVDGIDFTYGEVCGPANNITIRNAIAHRGVQFNPGPGPSRNNVCSSAPAMSNSNVVLDNLDFPFDAAGCTGNNPTCQGAEGRVMFNFGDTSAMAGITIKGSRFHGNCADGIQFTGTGAGRGVTIGGGGADHNEFDNILQGGCAPHADSIQICDGGSFLTVSGNYIHDNSTGLVGFCGASPSNFVFTKNVLEGLTASGGLCIGNSNGSVVEHNVFDVNAHTYLCNNQSGSADDDIVWWNNVQAANPTVQDAGTYASGSPNYNYCFSGATCAGANSLNGAPAPTFVGGTSPTTYAGYFLSSGTRGTSAASDGLSMGLIP